MILGTAARIQIQAMATNNLGLNLPTMLKEIGIQVDEEKLERVIELYAESYCDWLIEYVSDTVQDTTTLDLLLENKCVMEMMHKIIIELYIHKILLSFKRI